MMDAISIIGSIASVIGLILTWRVFVRVRKIERSYAFQALMPALLKRLKGFTSNLEQALAARDTDEMRTEAVRCGHVLESIGKLLPAGHAAVNKQICDKLDGLRAGEHVELEIAARSAIIDLRGEHERLRLLVAEMQWRQRDGN